MLEIRVDNRERDLIALWERHPEWPAIEVAQLEIADIVFTDADAGIHLLFERKTIADWIASRKDARYSEQKQRLLATAPTPSCVTYVLEGGAAAKLGGLGGGLSEEVLKSMEIHTMFRDEIRIVYTRSLEDTARWLVAVAERCVKNPAYFARRAMQGAPEADGAGPSTSGGYLQHVQVKTQKSANTTPKSVYLLQLSQLPGVSLKTATAIAGVYPSWAALTRAVTETPAALKAIPGVGPKRAAMLCEYITAGATPPAPPTA